MIRYSPAQITLHWLSALLVLVIVALPYLGDLVAPLLGGRGGVFTLHKSLGLTLLLLTVIRLVVRARYGTPDLLAAEPALQRFAARFGHALLYLVVLAMPISGLVFSSRAFEYFWLFPVGPLGFPEEVRDVAHDFHEATQWVLYALVLGHAAMALFHHYVKRDGVLTSMLPGNCGSQRT